MIKKADLKLRIAVILILLALSLANIFPLKEKINLGLDLKGGIHILLKADTSSILPGQVPRAIAAAVEKIRNRIDESGVKEIAVVPQGKDSILVKIPGKIDRKTVDDLRRVGKLEFKVVDNDKERIERALKGEIPEGYELKDYRFKDRNEKWQETQVLLEQEPRMVGSDLSESLLGFDNLGQTVPNLRFTSEGADKFAKVTSEHVDRQLAILLDGKVMSTPNIEEPILTGSAIIKGDFTADEARRIVSVLNSGALPVPLLVKKERSVGPRLGSDSILRGRNSILLGSVLVVIFVLVYYSLGGIISVICLGLDLIFILAGLHLLGATLTLPGIAGMILTLGMAVDANVLIFERIREELKSDKPLSIAVKNGFNRAKRTIFDANVTTLIAAVFLYIFGTGPIRGFATTLSLGIVASIFTAVFIGRTIFSLLLETRLKKFPMLSVITSSHIKFVKFRGVCTVISLILVIAGMATFYSKGDKIYGVDFKGGQALEYQITPPAEISAVRRVLEKEGFTDISIHEFKDLPGGVNIESKEDIASEVKVALSRNFKEVNELSVTTIGTEVGKLLRKKAYLAILLSLLGILIYVGFRFKHFDFAFAAVIALFHDVVVSLGFLTFFGYEVNLLTVTALLTIAGYSINDTIVIYDRIREISPRFRKSSLREIINTAINGTLSRTIITSITTLMVVMSIFFLGGKALHGFSFALLVGIITGTYSSIYIASPLVLLFRKSSV